MGRPVQVLPLTEEQRAALLKMRRAPSTPQKMLWRIDIVLAAAEGLSIEAIAQKVGCSLRTVTLWRRAFRTHGIEGLEDRPRPGRPKTHGPEQENAIIAATLTPPEDATHWSTRRLAKKLGVSHALVHRTWRAYRLQPHRTETFKYSRDPDLEAKVVDVVGLYLHPPENAIVLSVDEKSQIQALQRSQPMLPLRPGLPARQTHDYKRHGTTTLFAALEVAKGQVVGKCYPRHRHQEVIDFLQLLDKRFPNQELHLIWDNYSTHKHDKVQKWLAKHPCFHVHFTPTSASWLNQIETWFGILTNQRVRRGSFNSVKDLVQAIEGFIAAYNERAEPFVWMKTASEILAKAKRTNTSETRH